MSIAIKLWKTYLNVTTLVSFLPILYVTSHDSSVATVTRLRAARLTNCNSVPTECKTFCHVWNFRRSSGSHPASSGSHPASSSVNKIIFHRRWWGWAVNLATRLYQVRGEIENDWSYSSNPTCFSVVHEEGLYSDRKYTWPKSV